MADSLLVEKHTFVMGQIVPAGLLVTSGVLGIGNIKYHIQDGFPRTSTRVDDIFQYVPAFQMAAFDILRLKHRNSLFDQAKYLLISQAATAAAVHLLKKATRVERPNGGQHAFPSRHTSLAFGTATALWHEFKDDQPLLAGSGFMFATATGILRITNNAHWVTDVLAGAGIGILLTNMVYCLKPLKGWQPFNRNKKISFCPGYREEGLFINISF